MTGPGEHSGSVLEVGWSYYRQGDYQKAIQALRNATRTTTEPGLAHYRLGFCFRAIGQHGEAIKHFREAAGLNPHDAWAAFQVGKEFAISQQFRAALPEFARAIDRNAQFADAYHDGAACLGTLGHTEVALASFVVCSLACEIAVRTNAYTAVTISMLETAMHKLAGLLGDLRYHQIRARVWREFGMMRYPIPEDQLSLRGFETVGQEIKQAMRAHGTDEQELRRVLGL
jgi:tetratricopeptide (TPR) repeat protein